MKLRPLGDRYIVKKLKKEEKTAGGILLPDSAKKDLNKAKIVAVNPEAELKVDDIVLLANFAGNKIEDKDGNEFIVVKGDDIIAVEE